MSMASEIDGIYRLAGAICKDIAMDLNSRDPHIRARAEYEFADDDMLAFWSDADLVAVRRMIEKYRDEHVPSSPVGKTMREYPPKMIDLVIKMGKARYSFREICQKCHSLGWKTNCKGAPLTPGMVQWLFKRRAPELIKERPRREKCSYPEDVQSLVAERSGHATLKVIARELDEMGIKTVNGKRMTIGSVAFIQRAMGIKKRGEPIM